MNRQVVALGGTRKLASADTGPRISSVRLAIGYAVMVAALAATLLGSFTLGSRLEPVPNAAGVYRLDPRAQCLGGQIEVRQSGRFTDIAGERGSGGRLELDGRRLTGKVRCADGSTAPLQATVAGEASDRSLSGEVGGHRFNATLLRDRPQPAEAQVASGEHLTPEELFGRLMLAIAAVIVAARAVGALAARIGQPRVMGEVLAGILLGPTLLGALLPGVHAYLFPAQVIPLLSAAADLGLAFYMFLVGLELDPRLLRGRVAQAAFVSTASVAAPLLLGVALALPLFPLLGADTGYAPFALFLGAALSITAFPVLARILVERRMLNHRVGAMAMASAALNDVAAWFLLALAVTAATPAGSLLGAFRILGLAVVFSAAMALVVRRLVGRVSVAYDQAGHVPAGWVAAILVGVLLSAFVASLLSAAVTAQVKGRLADQLQAALAHRWLIKQAKGVLMGRENLDAQAAFERLRGAARSSTRRLADVARDVTGGQPCRPAGEIGPEHGPSRPRTGRPPPSGLRGSRTPPARSLEARAVS